MSLEKPKKKTFKADMTGDDTELFRSVINKIINPDLRSQSSDQDQVITVNPSVEQTRSPDKPVQSKPVHEANPFGIGTGRLDIITPDKFESIGYTKLINTVLDIIPQYLHPYELAIYLRLYRLSYGFNKSRCIVGMKALTKHTNVKESSAHKSLTKLEQMGLIRIIAIHNTGIKGTEYEVLAPVYGEPVHHTNPSTTRTRSSDAPNTHDDHDDYIKENHHQSVMKLYSDITGNKWQRSDEVSYQQIKHLTTDEITLLLRTTMQRAATKPNTLAYFVKVYQTPVEINEASRMVIKRKLEGFIDRFKNLQIGRKWTIADLSGYVKDSCAREGVTWDNEIFNQLIGG